jgi:hypothetical protein
MDLTRLIDLTGLESLGPATTLGSVAAAVAGVWVVWQLVICLVGLYRAATRPPRR